MSKNTAYVNLVAPYPPGTSEVGDGKAMENKKPFRPLTLRSKMAVFAFSLVLLAVVVGGFFVIQKVTRVIEEEMGLRALAIARTLAQMDEIKEHVGDAGGWEYIQPIAEKTRLATGVAYIVVLDMNRIRYSHPVMERIGKEFTDRDIGAALANHEYISRAQGVLGNSIRAFVPIKVDEGTRQVGVVVVGVLTPTMAQTLHKVILEVYSFLAFGLAIGLVGSLLLARNIKRAMFSMEPEEIARILQERIAIFQSMGEGVVAIDTGSRITVLNDEARRLLKLDTDPVGRQVTEVIPNTNLPRVLQTGEPEHNQELLLGDTVVISNRVPVKVGGVIVGAVATFRDKTEINALAEELTGIKAFVEAQRVQNHEYMNKLHTIAGLIQLKHYQQALDYIFDFTEEQQKITSLVSKRINDYRLAGMLLGKYARAKELRVNFVIDPASRLDKLPSGVGRNALVVIAGNLLENAFDSVRTEVESRRRVYFRIDQDRYRLTMEVRDWGAGIEPDLEEKIFTHGFSTKGKSRGIGLFLVQKTVAGMNGDIRVERPEDGGVRMVVTLPLKGNWGDEDDDDD